MIGIHYKALLKIVLAVNQLLRFLDLAARLSTRGGYRTRKTYCTAVLLTTREY